MINGRMRCVDCCVSDHVAVTLKRHQRLNRNDGAYPGALQTALIPPEVTLPLRIICPSCGRLGKAPEHAIGRGVRCPGCSSQYTLTAEMVQPVEQQAREAEQPKQAAPATPARPQTRPKAKAADDVYDLDEPVIPAPKPVVRPAPTVVSPTRGKRVQPQEPKALSLPVPVLVGGGLGLVLISVLGAWGTMQLFRGSTPTDQAVAATGASTSQPDAKQASAPAGETASSAATPRSSGVQPEPGMISVADAMQVNDVVVAAAPAPAAAPASAPVPDTSESAPEPTVESSVAANARRGAAAVATRDDGAGKILTTAEIVEESEPSVALIKGNGSSGTGFLVAPGLVATNSHVIDDELVPQLEVRFVSADEKHSAPLKAELLYEDPQRDIAFLAVKTDLKPLRVAKAYNFKKGEDITVIGNPGLGDGQVLENAISRGVMSTKTEIEGKKFYQLNIAINPGNSGGPVFDSAGRVVGVATLKSAKQESTGFSIPIEDLQDALAKLAKQSNADAERYRSRHRSLATVKGLGGGGALMFMVIDLRRADAVANNPQVKDLLSKLEPITAELDKEMFPSLATASKRIKNDPLLPAPVKKMIGDMNDNFVKIRDAYSSRSNVDDRQLRPWKQTHKQLITDLSSSLKLDFPAAMMVAFDDHSPAQATIITMGPQLGSLGSRLRQRQSTAPGSRTPGGITRPPSLRDRRKAGGR